MANGYYAAAFLMAATFTYGEGDLSVRSVLAGPLVTLDSVVTDVSNPRVVLGMKRGIVAREMGAPTFVFNRDLWVYSDFRGANLRASERRDVLLVAFTNDEVSQIRLTDSASVRALAARQKAAFEPSASMVAR